VSYFGGVELLLWLGGVGDSFLTDFVFFFIVGTIRFGILKGDVFLAEKMIAERIKAKEEKKE